MQWRFSMNPSLLCLRNRSIRIKDKYMYTVLVVDDEPANLQMVEYTLSDEYDVVPVKSGQMALKYLENSIPDLILLDILMPQMDGFEVYHRIREKEALKDIPVIFLTAANDVDTEENCFEIGAVDFIGKPFEPKIVLRRVRRTLELIHKNSEKGYVLKQDNVRDIETDKEKTLAVTVNGMDIRIFQSEIYYIEVFNNTCIIRTVNRELSVRETLDRMQQRLDGHFVRAGRSYLVNVRYVAELADDMVIMQNGKRIKLPRRNKKEIGQEILLKAGHLSV